MKKPIIGNIVPSITFFDEEGNIQKEANEYLIHHILANDADALFTMGSTGEGLFFKDKPEQKQRLLEIIRDLFRKYDITIPIVIGVYGETPEEVIEDARQCLAKIPNAGLVVPPPTNFELVEKDQTKFFSKIFSQLVVPIYLYNNPQSFGGTQITLDCIKSLRHYPNFLGIKDSSPSIENKKMYLSQLSEVFSVSCGKEGDMAKFLALIPKEERKLAGIVPSISNVVNTCSKIIELGNNGDDEKMLDLQKELNNFRGDIYDSSQLSGKAQRGVKFAVKYLYRNLECNFSQSVMPELQNNIPSEIKEKIKATIDKVQSKEHIYKIEE